MVLATRLRSIGWALALMSALLCALPLAATANPPRVPQVPLQIGWDGISLQSYLGGVGEGLNTLTDQLDLQTWLVAASGTATFSLRMEIAGYAGSNTIGIYNATEAVPTKFQVFPGAAGPGWYATCVFGVSGQLVVRLFDSGDVVQGITNFSGVDRNNFGFYLQGPAGTFWSQDFRNGGGKPQVLTFAGTGAYQGRWWECFEDLPYNSSDVDFQDSILILESLVPTAARGSSWGAIKALYR